LSTLGYRTAELHDSVDTHHRKACARWDYATVSLAVPELCAASGRLMFALLLKKGINP
jgi:hypothetical protein